jgi:cytochrome oxidase Cu insertion factor (SCO1/SenC/PrrC family)
MSAISQPPPGSAPGARGTPGAERMITALGIGLALLGLVGGLWAARWQKGPVAPEPRRHLADFTLTDRTGRTVTRADLTNLFLIVNCVFTSCSLSCRVVNERMAEIQGLVADQPHVRLVSLTVDPRTDTPSVLARFANGYRAETNRWLFLTGEKAGLYHLLQTSFVTPAKELVGVVPGGFADTDRIFLVDPRGEVRQAFNGLKPTTPREVVAALARLQDTLP